MTRIRFGFYFIPEDGELYRIGSEIVGYDIRGQKELSSPDYIDPAWRAESGVYGFHITITDAIYLDSSKLPLVIESAGKLISCLSESNEYRLTKKYIGFWRENSDQAAVIFTPNRSVEVLHDILVSAIHPLGEGSVYTDTYAKNPDLYFPESKSQLNKIKQFYSPYIFDAFSPHFTCINPFSGTKEQREILLTSLEKAFSHFSEISFRSIALVTQSENEPRFKIAHEFDLPIQ